MSGAIQQDAQNETTLNTIDDGAEAILKLWREADADNDQPSDDEVEDDNEEDSAEESDENEESAEGPDDEDSEEDADSEDEEDADDEDESDEDDNKKKKVLKDGDVVKVKVGDEELDVPVADLKRLYGQEKALTQKSMEVAQKRKEIEEMGERHVAAAEVLLTRAQERFAPYAGIDWALAVKELDTDEYKALRDEATRAYQDVKFYEQDLDGYLGEVRQVRHKELINSAKDTLKKLSDPKSGIPGFSVKTYEEMGRFAQSQGMPVETWNSLVDEVPLRLIHKAMLHEKGQKAVTKTKEKKPKKILKSKASSEVSRQAFTKSRDADAMKKFKNSGSQDDAAEALMARWLSDSD